MGTSDGASPERLHEVFSRARRLGLLGRVDSSSLITHARGFASGVPAPDHAVDLGSGAGLPGLVLALWWPESHWTLVDAGERRVTFLDQAVRDLGLRTRVECRRGRAEELAHTALRGAADLVVARSFGPPGVTAECAAGFLREGGRLVVSEPPDAGGTRWDPLSSLDLGLIPSTIWQGEAGHYASMVQEHPCPDQYPRRAGKPAKDPLF